MTDVAVEERGGVLKLPPDLTYTQPPQTRHQPPYQSPAVKPREPHPPPSSPTQKAALFMPVFLLRPISYHFTLTTQD